MADGPAPMTCLGCDYPLAGVAANACPECGRAFDPADRKTYGPRRVRPPKEARAVLSWRPPWYLFAVYFVFSAALIVPNASPVRISSRGIELPMAVWWLGSVAAIVLISLALCVARIDCLSARDRTAANPRWLLLPLFFFGWFLVGHRGLVWDARWHFARDNFDSLIATPTATWQPGWYGTFHVVDVVHSSSGATWLRLGFPDCYGAAPPSFYYEPGSVHFIDERGGPPLRFGNGLSFQWDPT